MVHSYKNRPKSTTWKLAQDAVEDARREILEGRGSQDPMTRRQQWLNRVWADRTGEFLEMLEEQFDPFHPSLQRFTHDKREPLAKTFPLRYFCLQDNFIECGMCSYRRPEADTHNIHLFQKHLAYKHKVYES